MGSVECMPLCDENAARLTFFVCALRCSCNGLLIAPSKHKDLGYVARAMVVTLSFLTVFLWQSRARGWGLPGVWYGLTLFFAARAAQSFPVTVSRMCRLPETKLRQA